MDLPIGYLLKVISDKMKVKADAEMKRHDMTMSQSKVLAFLHEKGGQAMQKEIEDYLRVSHPTVAGVVSRMEQNGFVETWQDPADRRNKVVCMTEKSVAIDKKMKDLLDWQEQQLVKSLTSEETETLKMLLQAVYDNLA